MEKDELIANWQRNASALAMTAMSLQNFASKIIEVGLRNSTLNVDLLSVIRRDCVKQIKNTHTSGLSIPQEAAFFENSLGMFEQLAEGAIGQAIKECATPGLVKQDGGPGGMPNDEPQIAFPVTPQSEPKNEIANPADDPLASWREKLKSKEPVMHTHATLPITISIGAEKTIDMDFPFAVYGIDQAGIQRVSIAVEIDTLRNALDSLAQNPEKPIELKQTGLN